LHIWKCEGPVASSTASEGQRSLDSIFSLGATNEMDIDGTGEEEEEATTTTSTSKWHKNTVKVLEVLRTSIRESMSSEGEAAPPLSLSSMATGVSRRTAAGFFFELLQLKTLNFIEVNQNDCQNYGDIVISAGPKFWEEPPTK
jgi:hypothetical protein